MCVCSFSPLCFVSADKICATRTAVLLTLHTAQHIAIPGDVRNSLRALLGAFPAELVPWWLHPIPGSTAVAGSRTNNPIESRRG